MEVTSGPWGLSQTSFSAAPSVWGLLGGGLGGLRGDTRAWGREGYTAQTGPNALIYLLGGGESGGLWGLALNRDLRGVS